MAEDKVFADDLVQFRQLEISERFYALDSQEQFYVHWMSE